MLAVRTDKAGEILGHRATPPHRSHSHASILCRRITRHLGKQLEDVRHTQLPRFPTANLEAPREEADLARPVINVHPSGP